MIIDVFIHLANDQDVIFYFLAMMFLKVSPSPMITVFAFYAYTLAAGLSDISPGADPEGSPSNTLASEGDRPYSSNILH